MLNINTNKYFKTNISFKSRTLFTGLLLIEALLFTASASAQQPIIAERKEGFKAMGGAMKALAGELKKDTPNAATMAAAAAKLAATAEKIPAWFPEGSGVESGVETDALPYIWKTKDKFNSINDKLIIDTKALAAATSGSDIAAIKKQLLVVKDTCSSCHESYRKD